MDNEKLNNEELNEEIVEETVTEEIEEAVAEPTEEAAESVDEMTAETVEDDGQEATDVADELAEDAEPACDAVEIADNSKNGTVAKIAAIAGGAVVLALIVFFALLNLGIVNPYEAGYVDITGETLEDMADQSGYSYKEYKKRFELPFFMPKSTNVNAAGNYVTMSAYSKISGMTIDEIKEQNGFGDDVTEKTTIGEASGNLKLSTLLGLDDVDEETAKSTFEGFKEFYELGDEVTLDTLYKDIRMTIDEKTRQNRLEEQKEQEEAQKKLEEESKETEQDEETDTETEEVDTDAE